MITNMDVLKDILDHLNDSVIIIDGYGQIVLYNNEAQRIQKSLSEKPIGIGAFFADIADEPHRQRITDILETLKKHKKPVRDFAEYETPFGSRVYLEMNFIPVLGNKKDIRYINIVTQDVTSRKLFEQRARAASADVAHLIEQAHAVIFSVDSRGYIVDWNDFCANATGFSKKEVLSRKACDLVICEESLLRFDALMATVRQNETGCDWDLHMKKKDGGEITVTLSATPRTNALGQVIGATLVGQDISELVAYRRHLEQMVAHKMAVVEQSLRKEQEEVERKNQFVSIASHEFRTPLSSIDFAANFIRRNAATIGKKKLNEKVATIEKHVNYMSHLLDDVQTLSKNDSGRIKLMPSEVRLDDFVQRAVEEVTCHTKHSHHIGVSTNQLSCLLTDEKLLHNVLTNLLTNAIKFSPGKDEISLNVLDQHDMVTFEVRDEGIGIPENELEKIFEPFIRGKMVTAIPGTGLGLSIVKKAVELLNGTLHVESVPAQGSVFRVTIPRQEYLE